MVRLRWLEIKVLQLWIIIQVLFTYITITRLFDASNYRSNCIPPPINYEKFISYLPSELAPFCIDGVFDSQEYWDNQNGFYALTYGKHFADTKAFIIIVSFYFITIVLFFYWKKNSLYLNFKILYLKVFFLSKISK